MKVRREKKDKREDRKCSPKIAYDFEKDFERGQLNFELASHTVKMTEEWLRRRGLGRRWDSVVKHNSIGLLWV